MLALALAFAAFGQGGAGGPAVRADAIRVGVSVEPVAVVVGQPVTVRIRMIAPAGSRFTFPRAIDSTGAIEPLDPVVVHDTTSGGTVETVATYRLLAWDVGATRIPLGPVRVERGGRAQDVAIADARVDVVSVLPADTSLHTPRPAREVVFTPSSRWVLWVLMLAGFAIVVLVGWALQRRSRHPPKPIEPFADAQRAFRELAALDLIGAGESAKHVASSADIVRAFLAARNGHAALGLTSEELARVLDADPAVPASRVHALLVATDSVKFAGGTLTATAAEALGAEAVAVVAEVQRADASAPDNGEHKR